MRGQMFMPVIAGKGADAGEIQDRLKKGADCIEVQLLDSSASRENISGMLEYAPYIRAVHTILSKSEGEVTVHGIGKEWSKEALEEACRFGEEIYSAASTGEHIGIVLHCAFGKEDTKRYCDTTDHIVRGLRPVLEQYPHCDLWIENGAEPYTCHQSPENLAEEIKDIMTGLNRTHPGRTGAVLDTCHALMVSEMHRRMYPKGGASVTDWYIRYIRAFAPIVKEVHFSDGRTGTDMIGKDHGIHFDRNDLQSMARFNAAMTAMLCLKYFDRAIICIEIREQDYYNAENFASMRRMILGFLQEEALKQERDLFTGIPTRTCA